VKLPEMKTGLAISALFHAALLVWGLISFAARPLEAKPNDAMPVDIISDKQFSDITKGVKNGAKDKPPTPLAEKVGDPKPIDDSSAKLTEKKELNAAKAEASPPPPAAEQPPSQTRLDKKEPPKVDPIAETLKKEEAKKKAEERAAKAKAEKLEREKKQAEAYDPTKIAALLDKRDPQRRAATGSTLSSTPSLGTETGRAATLTQNELDALRARLRQCWNVPVGLADARDLVVTVRIQFKQDGSLVGEPRVMNSASHPAFQVASESALRAIRSCAPYSFLPVAKYEAWKDVIVDFDPRDMFRG